jgi:outer membrane protein
MFSINKKNFNRVQRVSLLSVCLYLSHSQVVFAKELGLKEAFERAIQYNETKEINDARYDSAKSALNKTEGNYYPKVALKGSYTKLDNLSDQKNLALNLTQNLYKGGKDGLSIDSSELNIESTKVQKTQDEQTILKDVVDAYFAHWQNEVDVKNVLLLKDQSEKRRKEIADRVRIGRSRKGELLQADSQLATVEATLLNAEGLKKESLKKLAGLTGLNDSDIQMPQEITSKEGLQTLQDYLKMAEERPDLVIKKNKLEMAHLDVTSSKRNHFPTLDLTSNYYLKERTGSLKNSDWDVGVSLSVPLFEGGATEASVRESVAKKMEAQYSVNDQSRKIQSEVAVKYEAAQKFVDQLKTQSRALSLAKANYDETLKDFRLGLVTNLDTLSALNSYLDAKRTYDRLRLSSMLALELLNTSAGKRP